MNKPMIRKLKRGELLDTIKLIVCSGNNLRLKSGRKPWEGAITEVPALNSHLYDTDPEGHWGAYDDGKLIGFCASIVRGRQWYLGYLFIDPKYQLKGIGRKLLEHGLAHGGKNADSLALCTFPYNETAVALYASFGMMPTYPIFEMYRNIEIGTEPSPSKLNMEEDNSSKSILRINSLEKEIRGYAHQIDLKFIAQDPKHKIFQFYDGAKWVGYSVVASEKLIAPAGTISPGYLPDIVSESYRHCVEAGSELCRIWVGGPNGAVYGKLISLGFKISELLVFVSTKPYSDLMRYCPASLAIY
jgi:ribosomal protein S18 acetylase RimI-like enzyme